MGFPAKEQDPSVDTPSAGGRIGGAASHSVPWTPFWREQATVAVTTLIGAGLAGLLGGGHCLAMCGGFVAVMARGGGAPAGARAVPLLPARALAWRQLSYNAGRVTTYALLGAAAGGAGGALLSAAGWMPLLRFLYVFANVLLLALALAIAWKSGGLAWAQQAGNALFGKILPIVRPLLLAKTLAARYTLGMVWGLVPCALIYSVLPIALFAGGAYEGALVMLVFGIGTLPNLLATGWVVSRASGWLDSRLVRYASAALLAALAAVGIWRALFGAASLAQGPFCL